MLCVDFLYVRSIRHDFRDRDAKTTTFTDKKTDTYQLYNIVPHGDFKDRGQFCFVRTVSSMNYNNQQTMSRIKARNYSSRAPT